MAKTSGSNRGGGGSNSSAKVSKALASAEASIRHNKYETGVVVDSNGNEILRKGGGSRNVGFTDNELSLMKNAIFTHNHPYGLTDSFSSSDIRSAIKANVAELRAVTPSYTFSLKRPKEGWGNVAEVMADYSKAKYKIDERMRRYKSRYKGNKSTASRRATIVETNLVIKELSKTRGWKYSHKKV